MFLRFLGRIFLYFVIIPTITPLIKNVLQNLLTRFVYGELDKMTPEKRKPFDDYLRSTRRPRTPQNRTSTIPMGFQAH